MRTSSIPVGVLVLLLAGVRTAPAAETAETEPLANWEWYEEVSGDKAGASGRVDFLLTPSVFDRARLDLGDLRLCDAGGRVVPYALRVRRARDEQSPLPAREFNKATRPDRTVAVSLDLGAAPVEHNEIIVRTRGTNVRRLLHLEGSNDDKKWSTLLDKAHLMDFRAGPQVIDVHSFRYPVSRYRYLRVQVGPDRSLEDDKPHIDSVVVSRSIQVPGEEVTLPANLGPREPVPGDGGPGSAWLIDLGDRVPCEKLSFDIADEEFVRPYRLEMAGPDDRFTFLTRGEWRRRRGDKQEPLVISFPEVSARRLRLVVTDFRNPSLTFFSVHYTAPAREVIFAPPADLAGPLRLYFGNPAAEAPRYDFASTLPVVLDPAPHRASLGELTRNPDYNPPPKPWSERWPWLVYVVLGITSLVLLAILWQLGREAIARHDRAVPAVQDRHL